jgi:catechol 2,3-dioxygenase-like lactoylglutathione lyase family enzyme
MKPVISDLVQRYENGRLSRRELIQGLAFLVAASATAAAKPAAAGPGTATKPAAAADPGAAAAPGGPSETGAAAEPSSAELRPSGIDHVSVRVSDLERSATFYQSLFGLHPLSEDKPHRILRLGDQRVIISLRQDAPHGTIDHFGVGIRGFDEQRVAALLRQRGLQPQEDWEYGFYVRDPDGVPVQMVKST